VENRERFLEGLEIVRKAWTEERFSYRGRFFNIEELSVVPKPVQQPHPPSVSLPTVPRRSN
jgi:alkanesulfonate monooxygenase SsuD/methylene tetrahydromethanopterin reductase-like flavin-dependent oxidoreductase (luciferase family)